ncbi:MaoC family dehydratase [Reichenbachiella versicolor]|uniref:MaoC family dehydratase n=1 Tax=Reichenbachiella versicolor TaxID=1821036 RepID=UPI000D6EAD4E|nr:MaoC family dehydratase [Reichenbachiella versicolor]
MLKLGDTYQTEFSISQEEVTKFAEVCGDKNPVHLDADYAAQTPFKVPIVHGMFSASIISKVMGMEFPGEGTIYLGQSLDFKRPVYVDKTYEVKCEIIEITEGKSIAKISTKIHETERGKIVVDGVATVKNVEKLP